MSLIRRVAQLVEPLSDRATYRVRYGLARGLKRRGGLGFLAPHTPLSAEEEFLETLDLTGKTVYDIGGFEGLYTLFFARGVGPNGRVICFEPIPSSRDRITTNVRLNGFSDRVQLQPVAIGAREEDHTFFIPSFSRGLATGTPDIQATYAKSGAGQSLTARTVPLDSFLGVLPRPDLIKIDVEGMEIDVVRGALQTLRTLRPALFIETHGTTRAAGIALTQTILRDVLPLGYHAIHAETRAPITPDTVPTTGSVHLYCWMD